MPTPVSFDDFSGGITDHYLDDDTKRAARIDNFLLDEVKKPFVRDGTQIYFARLPGSSGQQKPTGIYLGPEPFNRPLVVVGENALYANTSVGWSPAVGPASNTFLPTKTDSTFESAVVWQRQLIAAPGTAGVLPQLIYSSDLSPYTLRALTVGLPELASTPTTAAAGAAWSGVYAFFYKYEYTDFLGVTFSFFGTPILLEVTNATGDPAAANITLNNIPTLANTALTNYDVTNVTVEIYRTINGGQDFFFLDSITNGTTSYVDSTSDTTIQNNEPIYTAGGALGFDQPPTGAIAVTQVNDYFWYATETTLYQSVAGNPGACPAEFADDFDQVIKGLSNISAYPILFCDSSVYRIEGTFDDFGNGGFARREIHPNAGCIAPRSIVRIPSTANNPAGLLWFGNGGIFYTNGSSVMKVSDHLDDSYSRWSNSQVSGVYDPNHNIVKWTISSTADNEESPNDTILVLMLHFGLSNESVFLTWSSENNFYPTAMAFSNSLDVRNAGTTYEDFYNKVCFTDGYGYVLYFDPLSFTDPLIDDTLDPASMKKKTIIYDFVTVGLNQGTSATRKYTPEVSFEVDPITPVAMQVQHRRDDGGIWSGTGGSPPSGQGVAGSPGGGSSGAPGVPELRQDGPITWNITDCRWLDDAIEHPWKTTPMLAEKRWVPFGQLRSERRQLRFTNSFTNIANSDTYGTATVDASARTVTLDDNTQAWIDDPEGYWITFETDEYVQTYMIKSRVSDTVLEVFDPYATLTDGSLAWVIKGYRKFERPRLVSFTLYAEDGGPTFAPSTTPQGANA